MPADFHTSSHAPVAPVLIIAFRRPDRLADVLERIQAAGTQTVYIAVDGPRDARDLEGVSATRQIATEVAWADALHLRFRETNLGCREGVIDAISWFFEHETRGLIIEDDSMPSHSFFPYAATLLTKHANDDWILAITGENQVAEMSNATDASYRFCQGGPCSAWATWSDRWLPFATERPDRNPIRLFRKLLRTPGQSTAQAAYWMSLMFANKTRVMDSWAYAFMIYGVLTRRLTVTPNVNLVEDRGVGDTATHMGNDPTMVWAAGELDFPLIAPTSTTPDPLLEPWSYRASANITLGGLARGSTRFMRRL
jgi:hypothetical protein